jgi:hypothetical protein
MKEDIFIELDGTKDYNSRFLANGNRNKTWNNFQRTEGKTRSVEF